MSEQVVPIARIRQRRATVDTTRGSQVGSCSKPDHFYSVRQAARARCGPAGFRARARGVPADTGSWATVCAPSAGLGILVAGLPNGISIRGQSQLVPAGTRKVVLRRLKKLVIATIRTRAS